MHYVWVCVGIPVSHVLAQTRGLWPHSLALCFVRWRLIHPIMIGYSMDSQIDPNPLVPNSPGH